MSKLIAILLLATPLIAAVINIPSQFIKSGTPCRGPSSILSWSPTSLTLIVDMAGFAASIGKDLLTDFASFTWNMMPAGFDFLEPMYVTKFNYFNARYCPTATDPTCGVPNNAAIYSTGYCTLAIIDSNQSIRIREQSMITLGFRLNMPNGDSYIGTFQSYCKPLFVPQIGLASINATNHLEPACVNVTFNNTYFVARQTPYNLRISAPTYTPYPDQNRNLNIFSLYTPKLYWDGKLVNSISTYSNGFYQFANTVDMVNTFMQFGLHTISLCNVAAPAHYYQTYNFTLHSQSGLALVTWLAAPKTPNPPSSKLRLSIFDTDKADTLNNVTGIILGTRPFNWCYPYTVEITLPSAYIGTFTVGIEVKSVSSGFVYTTSQVINNPAFNVTVPMSCVTWDSGIQIKVSGLKNPATPGTYQWGWALYTSWAQKITPQYFSTLAVIP